MAIREVDFAEAADTAAFGKGTAQRAGRDILHRAAHVGVLLFDDVAKARTSQVTAAAVYALLDRRAMHHLPVLWSGQSSSQWIIDKYGPDHGPAIAARLGREFCDVTVLHEKAQP